HGPVADLVVVLQAGDEPVAGDAGVGAAVGAAAEAGVAAVVQDAPGEHFGERGQSGEVGVVAVGFAADRGVQGVVDVVVPLGGHAEPAGVEGAHHARVVQVGFGDQRQWPADGARQGVHFVGEF